MNGAGNDFVVIDNRNLQLCLSREDIAALCHRQFGVGADGLLAVEPAEQGADYRMRYYNSDGGEASLPNPVRIHGTGAAAATTLVPLGSSHQGCSAGFCRRALL